MGRQYHSWSRLNNYAYFGVLCALPNDDNMALLNCNRSHVQLASYIRYIHVVPFLQLFFQSNFFLSNHIFLFKIICRKFLSICKFKNIWVFFLDFSRLFLSIFHHLSRWKGRERGLARIIDLDEWIPQMHL